MNRLSRGLTVGLATLCCVGAMATPALAAGCGGSGTKTNKCDTGTSYNRQSYCKTKENISAKCFEQPDVTVNTKTNAINNVYNKEGELVPATLSSDGHFYIVPTNDGYLYIGTGC